jgi:hypothetical protein
MCRTHKCRGMRGAGSGDHVGLDSGKVHPWFARHGRSFTSKWGALRRSLGNDTETLPIFRSLRHF